MNLSKKMRISLLLILTVSSIFWVVSAASAAEQPNTVMDFPGTYPGAAVADVQSVNFKLENDVLSMKWNIANNHFVLNEVTNKLTNAVIPIQTTHLFKLTLQDNRVIPSSSMQLVSGPTLTTLTGDPTAMRMSERDDGKKISAEFKYNQSGLQFNVLWSAVLRDGSNNVQQRIEIVPVSGTFNLKYAQMIDIQLAGAQTLGSDNGKTIVTNDLFMGIENPMAISSVSGNQLSSVIEKASEVILAPDTLTYTASIGVIAEDQLRRSFLYYLERERIQHRRVNVKYVSWFDLVPFGGGHNEANARSVINTLGTELVTKRGAQIDTFLWDDAWDDIDGPVTWTIDSSMFPNQFVNMKADAEQYNADLGVWFSPFGGYGSNAATRRNTDNAKPNPYAKNAQGFKLSDPNYYNRVKDMTFDMMRNQGVSTFKIDGIGGGLYQSGPSAENRKDYEYLLKLALALREEKPDVWLSVTVGTWSSPYWYFYIDSVYRDDADQPVGFGVNSRQKLITGRDAAIYQHNVQQNILHPISSLMAHGFVFTTKTDPPIYGDTNLLDPQVAKETWDDMKWYFASGFSLQELHLRYQDVNDEESFYDHLAKYIIWSKENINVMTDTRMVGTPGSGKPYAYASWSKEKSILAVRNPYNEAKLFTIDPQSIFEIPNGEAQNYKFIEIDEAYGEVYASEESPALIYLQPNQVLVFEAYPTTEPAPTESHPELTTNVALGKATTSSSAITNAQAITNGTKFDSTPAEVQGNGAQWIQIDLEQSYNINRIQLWHSLFEEATYQDVVVQLSNTAGFSTGVVTVFNNDTDNSLGLGVGTDIDYVESSAGKKIEFSTQNARYVRLYSNGNSIDTLNQYSEVEVWTTPLSLSVSENVASGVSPSSSAPFLNLVRVTDGNLQTNLLSDSYPNDGLQWIQLDLGSSKLIDKIKLWHYYGDSRSYRDVIVQLSNTSDFSSGVTTVFNNDTNNSAGLGVGTDQEYYETSEGKTINFTPISARYVRFYSNGNSNNNSNHYVEAEVWSHATSHVPVTEVQFSTSELTVQIGESQQLEALISPNNASETGLVWESSDPSIVSINANGMAIAQQAGTAMILVASVDGGYTSKLKVTVAGEATTDMTSTLTTNTSVVPYNNTFTVTYSTQSSVPLYAQDVTIQYDPASFELVTTTAPVLRQSLSLVNVLSPNENGEIRLLLASMGESNPMLTDQQLITLTFKNLMQQANSISQLQAHRIQASDGIGQEYEISSSIVTVKTSTNVVGDLTGDGLISIGDLAILASYYGATVEDSNWPQISHFDLHGDGVIDIKDLAILANLILAT